MERTSNKGDFRANISQNGSGRKIKLRESEIKICLDSAKARGLEFTGVHIVKDANGKVFVFEVNGNPGTKIIDLTGHNYFFNLVKFTKSKANESKENIEEKTETKSSVNIKHLANLQYQQRMCLYITKEEQKLLNLSKLRLE